jgi:multiple sugar transport system permease protein
MNAVPSTVQQDFSLVQPPKPRRNYTLILMLLPAVIFLLVMSIYPTVRLVQMSLTNMHLLRLDQTHYVGLQNFQRLIDDKTILNSFKFTAMFVGVGVSTQFVLGLSIALFLDSLRWGKNIFRIIAFAPMMVPPVVVGITWRLLYDPQLGLISYYLNEIFGTGRIAWLGDPAIARWAVIIIDVWQWTPFLAMIYLAGLQSIPVDYYEAAQIDGANSIQTLFRVTIPLLKPILIIGLLFRVIDSIKTFDLIYTTTKGGPGTLTEVFSYKVFQTMFTNYRAGYAAALSLLMLVIVTLISKWLVGKIR